MRTAWERHVGDLPAFGVFLLPRGFPGSLSVACQSQMQVASMKQNVCHGRGEDYCWKEIAGEWQGHGTIVEGERHGMCESGFNTKGKRHGMCASGFNTAG